MHTEKNHLHIANVPQLQRERAPQLQRENSLGFVRKTQPITMSFSRCCESNDLARIGKSHYSPQCNGKELITVRSVRATESEPDEILELPHLSLDRPASIAEDFCVQFVVT